MTDGHGQFQSLPKAGTQRLKTLKTKSISFTKRRPNTQFTAMYLKSRKHKNKALHHCS